MEAVSEAHFSRDIWGERPWKQPKVFCATDCCLRGEAVDDLLGGELDDDEDVSLPDVSGMSTLLAMP